jgi:hypothetical protein
MPPGTMSLAPIPPRSKALSEVVFMRCALLAKATIHSRIAATTFAIQKFLHMRENALHGEK